MQDTNPAFDPEALFFQARLTPYRSLGREGFGLLMAALIIAWGAAGLIFAQLGAWPVFGFFGLDVILVYLAFRTNYRDAQQAEEVSLSRTKLLVRRTEPSGKISEYSFNPFWTRFRVSRHEEFGITAMHLESKDRHLILGQFLNAHAREEFARDFATALARAKS
ncbi:DUF2244 domain-containing protein [Limoniibacter endophyticus]|nr:DUF2244 domain-containing protein [Limoniibacter endophyticus]